MTYGLAQLCADDVELLQGILAHAVGQSQKRWPERQGTLPEDSRDDRLCPQFVGTVSHFSFSIHPEKTQFIEDTT